MKNHEDLVRGPRSCWRTRNLSAPCTVCGCYSDPVHVPLDRSGFFCAVHCPNCQPAAVDHERVALEG